MRTTPEILLDKERFCIEMGKFHAIEVRILLQVPEVERDEDWLANYQESLYMMRRYVKHSNTFSQQSWLQSE